MRLWLGERIIRIGLLIRILNYCLLRMWMFWDIWILIRD